MTDETRRDAREVIAEWIRSGKGIYHPRDEEEYGESASADARSIIRALHAAELQIVERGGVRTEYDEPIDSLFVHFHTPTRPAVGMVLERHITALVDPETDQLLGVEIDHFRSEVLAAAEQPEPTPDASE